MYIVIFHDAPLATREQTVADWSNPYYMDAALRAAYDEKEWRELTQFPAYTVLNERREFVHGKGAPR